ncbi:MAG: flagellar protein export ATPase FliI [Candidatus Latescibacteria bacterium]|nr:flagellar protein export ATPase FliI [Candidatus Latescibacterota bacterium]
MLREEDLLKVVQTTDPILLCGKIVQAVGIILESNGPDISLGERCRILDDREERVIESEVVGFRGSRVLLMPLGSVDGVGPGDVVIPSKAPLSVGVSEAALGRILDGLGRPMDGKGPIHVRREMSLTNTPPNPLKRRRITDSIGTGVRAIDTLLTCGKGQRVGIFSGSGIGKSTLLGMIARDTEADVNVISLVGERGKEVRDFIERDLGEEGLRRSVVVVSTADQSPLTRVKAAFVATAVAEYFRDEGYDVMLMMDSITRVAMAQREVGLAAGEPPTTKGYTPSVFALLPRLLERAGTSDRGGITGLYTVLVEGNDLDEPIADAARSILDGHIVLSRRLASQNHYPAIDVLESVSRVMIDVVPPEHLALANRIKELVAVYREAEDLINIGAYVRGSNRRIDTALEAIDRINTFLRQGIDEHPAFHENVNVMMSLLD